MQEWWMRRFGCGNVARIKENFRLVMAFQGTGLENYPGPISPKIFEHPDVEIYGRLYTNIYEDADLLLIDTKPYIAKQYRFIVWDKLHEIPVFVTTDVSITRYNFGSWVLVLEQLANDIRSKHERAEKARWRSLGMDKKR